MHRIALGLLLVLVLATHNCWADDAPPAGAGGSGQAPAAGAAVDSAAAGAAGSESGDKWRFRRHQGHWWYWLPTNQWVYWTGDKWEPYEAESYAKFHASQQPQQSYSYSNGASGNTQGNLGPKRYDRFGNLQYPYSQRRGGLQQLGPVPAMGGVRSLPGWGGER